MIFNLRPLELKEIKYKFLEKDIAQMKNKKSNLDIEFKNTNTIKKSLSNSIELIEEEITKLEKKIGLNEPFKFDDSFSSKKMTLNATNNPEKPFIFTKAKNDKQYSSNTSSVFQESKSESSSNCGPDLNGSSQVNMSRSRSCSNF